MKKIATKTLYTLARLAWRLNLKETSFVLSGWAFRISHKPKTYR